MRGVAEPEGSGSWIGAKVGVMGEMGGRGGDESGATVMAEELEGGRGVGLCEVEAVAVGTGADGCGEDEPPWDRVAAWREEGEVPSLAWG